MRVVTLTTTTTMTTVTVTTCRIATRERERERGFNAKLGPLRRLSLFTYLSLFLCLYYGCCCSCC